DGRVVWIRDEAVLLGMGSAQTPILQGVMLDVSDRRRIEAALLESHNLLRGVIEGATDMIYVKDLQGRYRMINSSGARLMCVPADEAIGKDDPALFPPETAAQFMADDQEVIRSSATQTFEESAVSDGIRHTFLSTKTPYRDHQGQIIGVIGVSHDIT